MKRQSFLLPLLALLCVPAWSEPPTLTTTTTTTESLTITPAQTLKTAMVTECGMQREPGGNYAVYLRGTPLLPALRDCPVKLGIAPLDVRLNTKGAKASWLPASLYLTPIALPGSFTKTGAAKVAVKTESTATATGPGRGDITVNTHFTNLVTEDPHAKTTFTYTRFAVYGVLTANINHLFDWNAMPLLTEHPRVGVGMLWAHQGNIPDGVAYDRAGATERWRYGLMHPAAPNAAVHVAAHGFEISRSIDGGPKTWYFSFVTALEN